MKTEGYSARVSVKGGLALQGALKRYRIKYTNTLLVCIVTRDILHKQIDFGYYGRLRLNTLGKHHFTSSAFRQLAGRLRMRRDRSGRWIRLVRAMLTALGLWFIAPLAARGEMLLVNGSFVASGDVLAENDRLGQAVAVSGDMLVATAPMPAQTERLRAGPPISSSAPSDGSRIERKKLTPLDGAAFDTFGAASPSLATPSPSARLSADIAGVQEQGAVYVFERNAGGSDNWGHIVQPPTTVVGSANLAPPSRCRAICLQSAFPKRITARGGFCCSSATAAAPAPGATPRRSSSQMSGATAAATAAASEFGGAIPDGDRLLPSEPTGLDVSYTNEEDGAAYLFARDPVYRDRWTYVTRLVAHGAAVCFGGRFLELDAEESRIPGRGGTLRPRGQRHRPCGLARRWRFGRRHSSHRRRYPEAML